MKTDTRNYGKFHKRFAEGGLVDDDKQTPHEKELEDTAAGRQPWYEQAAKGIKIS